MTLCQVGKATIFHHLSSTRTKINVRVPSKDRDRHPRLGEWNKGDRQPAASQCRKYTCKTPFTASSLKASNKGGRIGCILSGLCGTRSPWTEVKQPYILICSSLCFHTYIRNTAYTTRKYTIGGIKQQGIAGLGGKWVDYSMKRGIAWLVEEGIGRRLKR